jgi:dipeptidyl aminopeptidase/acylaminoacyl peptidase
VNQRTTSARRSVRLPLILGLALSLAAAYAVPFAQAPAPAPAAAKKAITVDDYTKWKNITSSELSGDGKWLTYGVSLANTVPAETKPVLHLLNLQTNQKVDVTDGTGGTFSPDSMWLAYTVDPGTGGRGGRGRPGGAGAGGTAPATTPAPTPTPPSTPTPTPTPQVTPQAPAEGRGAAPPAPPRRAELRNLSTGAVRSWQDIQSFTFSPNSTHLLLRRRPPQAAGAGRAGGEGGAPPAAGAAPDAPAGPRGVDVIIHNLVTGRDQLLGSVGDISFNRSGEFLAYTVDAAPKDGNGLFVLDLKGGRVIPLENDAKSYNRMAWNEDGTALAVLKGGEVERMRERDNLLVVYADVRAAVSDSAPMPAPVVLDPAKAPGFPKGWVVSDRAAISWSDDNQRVLFGIKAQVPTPGAARRPSTDEVADVDVWNTSDERIQSMQMVRLETDRNFTFRSAFDVAGSKFIKLADETMRDIDIAITGKWAVGRDARGYVRDYGRPEADVYRVDTTTGERTPMFKKAVLGPGALGISPNGKHYAFWRDNKIQVYDLETAATRVISGSISFADMEDDHPGPKPSYGLAGYTKDGKSVVAQHRYDLWLLPLDGSAPRNLTGGYGTKNEVRLRLVRTTPVDPLVEYGPGGITAERVLIDLSKPITLSAYGEYSKKAGFFELANGQLKEIVFEDAAFSTPQRAAKADTYVFTRQTFVEFPDLRISGPNFKDAKKITDVNPQQSEYRWGRRLLFDYKNKDGLRLQGILAIPDDYKEGEKRPMIVTFYEKNSQNMHRYSAPSYLTGMGSSPIQAVTEGYLTMLPDVHFRTGSSHSDMLECVEAAVRRVIELGYADPKRIGVTGHSYGGEGAAFIGVRSKMFAAVGMGAGVTDLYSDFNQSWGWTYQVTGGSGANGHDYYLFGQGRWGFTPWDNPEVYRFESAITHVKDAVAPFLIMHGTADPTVSFTEGMNFYQGLRYYNKKAVLLAYPGEGHGLRGMANRKDLTVRFFEFFNHYLKGAPAPKWLTEGVKLLDKK